MAGPYRAAEHDKPEEPSLLEKALGIVTEVRPGEGVTALLLTLNVFLVLTAYYVIKPVREGLILAMPSGAQYKSYLGGVIAASLLVLVPIYGRAADRYAKNKLVIGVTLFFASHLLVFFALSKTSVEASLGIAFFVWMGVFSMMVVAQFWAFAADVYTEEQGKRLFALVGMGQAAGGVVGAWVTKLLVEPPPLTDAQKAELALDPLTKFPDRHGILGTYELMLVGAAFLAVSAAATYLVSERERLRKARAADPGAPAKPKEKKVIDQSGTFALVFRHKYLILIAAFSLVFTLVNTNGEFMLGEVVSGHAKEMGLTGGAKKDFITGFYGDFFLYVNIAVVLLQTFVVSRLVKFGGLRIAFFVLPMIALADAVGIAVLPMLGIVRIGKIAENSTDYSVNNTVRNMLWLPTTTEMKYKAKQAIDTFFVRAGDMSSALVVFVLSGTLHLPVRVFAALNVALILAWLFLARGIVKENSVMQARVDLEKSG
jgi:AAA family ATP:ADP antiporter